VAIFNVKSCLFIGHWLFKNKHKSNLVLLADKATYYRLKGHSNCMLNLKFWLSEGLPSKGWLAQGCLFPSDYYLHAGVLWYQTLILLQAWRVETEQSTQPF
jgi:hypothetical protein